jgi:hypothetical protein
LDSIRSIYPKYQKRHKNPQAIYGPFLTPLHAEGMEGDAAGGKKLQNYLEMISIKNNVV